MQVTTREGEPHNLSSAPQYLVCPLDWDYVVESSEIGANMITYKACVIDFGESYEVSSPPLDLGIPMAYCAPEYDLEKKTGISNDLWALGCTLFEIRAGRKLFDMFEDELDEHLFIIATILGKMPEPWWSETWEGRRENFKDGVDEAGRVMAASSNILISGRPRSLREAITFFNKRGLDEVSQKEVNIFVDLLAKLLRYRPAERISAREALEHDWFKF